jgi:hypothetical protein
MSLVLRVKCKMRNWAGIRQARALPPRGRKPPIGVAIVCADVRMIVPAGMSDELWEWLMDQGWREVTYRPDHRIYRQVPTSRATQLVDADKEVRMSVLESAIAHAELRTCYRVDPDALPAYVRVEH